MNTSNPAARTRLGGTSTIASSNLHLNTGYLSQSSPFEATGVNTLTEHMYITLGTTIDNTSWANMIDAMYRTLQINSNRVPSYGTAQLSSYVSMAQNIQIALYELYRDMRLGAFVDPYSMSTLRDFFGEEYDQLYSSFVSNKAQNVADFNYFVETTRNVYPVPATSFVNLGKYLLGNVFRDDSTRRGQYFMMHSVYAMKAFTLSTSTVPGLNDFATRLKNIQAIVTKYLTDTVDGVANAKVAAQIASDITKVYGAYAYWDVPTASLNDTLVPVTDSVLMHALNFDTNGVWDLAALQQATTGTNITYHGGVGALSAGDYVRYGAYFGAFAADIALSKVASIDHVVISDTSSDPVSDDLADLFAFTGVPILTGIKNSSGETDPVVIAASASGITIGAVWYNTVVASPTSGSFTTTRVLANPQTFVASNATTISLAAVKNATLMSWVNALTPSIIAVDKTSGRIASRNILAEVDEVTNVEFDSLKNMLVTYSQRYTDMFTLFQTRAPKVEAVLKPGAVSVDVGPAKRSNATGKEK